VLAPRVDGQVCKSARGGGRRRIPVQLGERREVLEITEQQADVDGPRDRSGGMLLGLEYGVLGQLVVDPAPVDSDEQWVSEWQELRERSLDRR
jgi:hypothetical protein